VIVVGWEGPATLMEASGSRKRWSGVKESIGNAAGGEEIVKRTVATW
jgi:hypothetical protein